MCEAEAERLDRKDLGGVSWRHGCEGGDDIACEMVEKREDELD